MPHLLKVLRKPAALRHSHQLDEWFGAIADALLNSSNLLVADEPHRLAEIEFYYHGLGHLDSFSHRQPLQQRAGLWCFHRTGTSYRNGSFKGLDLSFGHPGAFGGILIRALETAGGRLIDGPSLCVDHLLRKTGYGNVSDLDRTLARYKAWDASNPLRLIPDASMSTRTIFRSARVGLTLKNAEPPSNKPFFIHKLYRFLTQPRRIRKGKPQLVLALHLAGRSAEEIQRITGSPRRVIERHLHQFEAGSL